MARPSDPKYPLKRYFATEKEFTDQVNAALRVASEAIKVQVEALADIPMSEFQRARLSAQAASLQQINNASYREILRIVSAGQSEAAKVAYDAMWAYQAPLLKTFADSASVEAFIKLDSERAAASIRTMMDRLGGSYRPLSESVYKASAWVNGEIEKRMNAAILRNLSARDFAKSVIDLVNPDTPGGSRYAAQRLARTEINNAFHESAIRQAKNNGIVEMMRWSLSGSHPEGDICDSYAQDSPYMLNEVPAKPHPQCFCYITPELPSPEEFRAKLLAGGYDDLEWNDSLF